jgi:cation:H+ antiporter
VLIRVDIPIMGLVTLACAPVFLTGGRITRWEGGLFVAAYLAYLGYLVAAHA